MKQNKMIIISLLLIILTAGFSSTTQLPQEAEKHKYAMEATFSEHEFKAHLKFLASDMLEGRADGTRGGELAAAYIAAQFEAAGLEPISDEEGYFQRIAFKGITTDYKSLEFSLSANGQSFEFAPIEEVIMFSEFMQDSVSHEDELIFVGYGIVAPEYDWDDYKGLDVEGKTLVMLVNDPDLEKTGFANESLSFYGRWTYKEIIAREKRPRDLSCYIRHRQPLTAGTWFRVPGAVKELNLRVNPEIRC